jgi:N6-adenosine-specific RNA methylase IME4
MKYSLIYADPAWEYGNTVSNGAATNHYGTMKLIDMKRLPVWDLAADDAVLAMWFTGTHTREAIELAEAWGFKVRTMKGFTWVKFNPLAEQHINKALQAGGGGLLRLPRPAERADPHERRQLHQSQYRRHADRHQGMD